MAEYKKKFGKKEVEAMLEVLTFLWREAEVAEKELNAMKKHRYETMAVKLSNVLYKE